jgi:hypothetical protein
MGPCCACVRPYACACMLKLCVTAFRQGMGARLRADLNARLLP